MSPTPYQSSRTAAVLLDRSERLRVEVAGPDRAKFLHNLTTNDVKRLPAGQGVEAFVTSPQGKTLGYVTLLAADDRIWLRTDPVVEGPVLPHLAKYGVFDDVTVVDATASTFELHLAGPRAADLLEATGAGLPDDGPLRHRTAEIAGVAVRVVRESPFGAGGLTLIGPRDGSPAVLAAVRAAGEGFGLADLDGPTAEALRVEAGTPAAGRDVTPDNLPQEVARDDRAINFVKGCYLGQETVARIDALGHVNKLLRGFRFEGDAVPPPGASVEADGKKVGTLTSTVADPAGGGSIGLGYVRTTHAGPGTAVEAVSGDARWPAVVSALPMSAGPEPGA